MPRRLVTVEEHHEAFFVWHYARANGWMPAQPIGLLHVDEHADLCLPVLRRPLESLTSLAQVARFVYSDLSINTFICPAIYQGFFDRAYWLRIKHDAAAGGWRRLQVAARTANRLRFSMNSSAVLGSKEGIDYAPLTTADSLPSNLAWALDIDLDYFCWNDYPELPECMLEVPESVYDDFRLDRYHFLRLSLNAKTAAVKRDGKFYLAFEYVPRPEPHVTAQAIVAKRIDDFIAYLSRHRADPRIITLCRSRHSGYVQSRNLEFAESLLLERLHSITPFEKHSIDDLLAQHLLPEEVFHGTPVQPEEHQYA